MSWFEQFIFVFKHIPWMLGDWAFPLTLACLLAVFLYCYLLDRSS